MTQVKTNRDWHRSRLERQVSEIARYDAEREPARIPWPVLHEAREKYIAWEASCACCLRLSYENRLTFLPLYHLPGKSRVRNASMRLVHES